MVADLRFSRAAVSDLAALRQWYSQPGSGRKAKETANRILRVIADLAEHPELWQEVGNGVQAAIVAGHVVHYRAAYSGTGRTAATTVYILRIWPPRADLPRKWPSDVKP